jgi:hypothetical protein
MAKGGKREGSGRKHGSKQDPERQLLKNLFALEIIPKNRVAILKRCSDIIATGRDEDFLSLIKTMPKDIGFDKDTIKTLAGWLGGKE